MRWLIIGLSLAVLCPANAQYYFYSDKRYAGNRIYELGITLGMMNSLTDLGGRRGNGGKFIKDLDWHYARPSFGIYFLWALKEAVKIRGEAILGTVAAEDAGLARSDPDPSGRYGRNLSFRSRIMDFHIGIEFHPLFLRYYDTNESPYLSPYLVAGAGYFRFNPKAELDGEWYALRRFRLEGQGFAEYPSRKPYRLGQWNIPVGLGIKFELGLAMNLRLELLHRFLFTDYLDDVSQSYIDPRYFDKYLPASTAQIARRLYQRMQERQPMAVVNEGDQRGNPGNKDAYLTVMIKWGLVIQGSR